MSLDNLSLDHASLDHVPLNHAPLDWSRPGPIEILRWPLPDQGFGHRLLIRGFALMACRHVLALRGIEHVLPDRDPFILAANHSTRLEAVSLPSLLILRRGGCLIHFLADWNFRLIPGIGLIYRHSQAVTVTRKPAHSPYGFHTRIMGFFPVATHDVGELQCRSRRITLVLDIRAAYKRLKTRGTWIYRYFTSQWDEALHQHMVA